MTTPEIVRAMVSEGKTHREIAGELGISLSTVSKHRNRPPVPEEYTPESSESYVGGGELFKRWAEESREFGRKREEEPHDLLVTRLPEEPVLLLHGSDWHIGAKGTEHDRLWRDMSAAASVGAYMILGGDLIDNPVKHRSHIIHSTSTPSEQIRALRYLLRSAQESGMKFIGGVSGNHCQWSEKEVGLDIMGPVLRDLDIPYSPHQLRIVLRIGRSETRILLRHTYRFKSQFDLSAQFRRMWDEGSWDFDIGALGHVHQGPYVAPFWKHGVERWASLAGSYKTVDSYGEEAGFNPARTGFTAFVIEPSGLIHGFASLRDAAIFKRGLEGINI